MLLLLFADVARRPGLRSSRETAVAGRAGPEGTVGSPPAMNQMYFYVHPGGVGASHEQVCGFGTVGMWYEYLKSHHDLHPLPEWTYVHILINLEPKRRLAPGFPGDEFPGIDVHRGAPIARRQSGIVTCVVRRGRQLFGCVQGMYKGICGI